MKDLNKKQYDLDFFGLLIAGMVSLGYIVFGRELAERHIQFSFLNFPIFVGEISLLVCLLLFEVKYWDQRPKFTKWHWIIVAYFSFVFLKASYGYFCRGPLALRHAALLYYPVFAVFSYVFFRKDFFSPKNCFVLSLIVLTALLVKHGEYWPLGLMLLGAVFIKAYPDKRMQLLMFLALLIATPYKQFFYTSRMMILSNFVSGLFLAATLPIVLRVGKKVKFALVILIAGVVIVGLLKFADHGAVKSIVAFGKMTNVMRACDKYMKDHIDHFTMAERKEVKLYNPDRKDVAQERAEVKLKRIIIGHAKDKISDFSFKGIDMKIQKIASKEVKQEMTSILDEQLPKKQFPESIKTKTLQIEAKPLKVEMPQVQAKPKEQADSTVSHVETQSLKTQAPQVQADLKEQAGLTVSQVGAKSLRAEMLPQVQVEPKEQTDLTMPQVEVQSFRTQAPQSQVKSTENIIKERREPVSPVVPQVKPPKEDIEAVKAKMRQILLEQVDQEIRKALVGTIASPILVDNVKSEIHDTLVQKFKQNTPVVPSEKTNTGWVDNNNAVFRLLIWRDMLTDLVKEKPLLGFDFGKPFRSKSLEILNWGSGDWERDGWIEPHNSYLHIIYRTGLVGILWIFSFLTILLKMIKGFIRSRSFTGICLCGIIVEWFVAANFLVIFELPYTAVPIWTIYGITLAYYHKIQEKNSIAQEVA